MEKENTLPSILGGGSGDGLLGNVGTVSVDISLTEQTFQRLMVLALVIIAASATAGLVGILIKNQISK